MGSVIWTAYDVLGIHPGATLPEIKAAWKSKAWELHPDHGGDPALFNKASLAYEELTKEPVTAPELSTQSGERVYGYDDLDIDFDYELFTPEGGMTKQEWVDGLCTPPTGYHGTRQQWVDSTIKRFIKLERNWEANHPIREVRLNILQRSMWWKCPKRLIAEQKKHNPNYTWITPKSRVLYYLVGVVVSAAAIFARLSGVTYDLLRPHNGQPIFLSNWAGRPHLAQMPLHTTGAAIMALVLGLLIGTIWAGRVARGRFHRIEKITLALVISTIAFAGEFIVAGKATNPVLVALLLYTFLAGRITLRLPKLPIISKSSKRKKAVQSVK